MAKSKKEAFSFSEMGDLLRSVEKDTGIVVKDLNSETFRKLNNDDYIGTGIYVLNAAFSGSIFGGVYPRGLTTLAGEEATGKSYLCLQIAREAQQKGYNIIYFDTEGSITPEVLENAGVDYTDSNKFLLMGGSVLEEMTIFFTRLFDNLKTRKKETGELAKVIIFIDSGGQLSSKKEIENALEANHKSDMTRAKAVKSFFRIINNDLNLLNIPLIVTNHIYMTQDFFPKAVLSGGTGFYYTSTAICMLSKAKDKEDTKDEFSVGQSGIIVTAKFAKNRQAQLKKIKFVIDFTEGSNPYHGLEYFLTDENYNDIGIAKGKLEKDKNGNETFKPGGNRWYVRHLDKSVTTNQLFNANVFTMDILQKIDKYAIEYFKYKSREEREANEKEFNELLKQEEIVFNPDLDSNVDISDDLDF